MTGLEGKHRQHHNACLPAISSLACNCRNYRNRAEVGEATYILHDLGLILQRLQLCLHISACTVMSGCKQCVTHSEVPKLGSYQFYNMAMPAFSVMHLAGVKSRSPLWA